MLSCKFVKFLSGKFQVFVRTATDSDIRTPSVSLNWMYKILSEANYFHWVIDLFNLSASLTVIIGDKTVLLVLSFLSNNMQVWFIFAFCCWCRMNEYSVMYCAPWLVCLEASMWLNPYLPYTYLPLLSIL